MKSSLLSKLQSFDLFIYNKYFDKYTELIESNRTRKYEKYLVQKHHIIPRCYYTSNNLPVDNSKDNTVYLMHKDHLLAHYYLALCSKDKEFRYKNELAIRKIFGMKHFKALETYEKDIEFIKNLEEYNDIMTECNRIKSENYKGRTPWNKGKKMSPETIAKRIKSRSGYKHSEETILKIKQSNIGKSHSTTCITNGIVNKIVKIEKLPEYEEQGFWRGKTFFGPHPRKGMSLSEEAKQKMRIAALKRFENAPGTMLGKHLTEEQRKKCSDSHKGCRLMNKDGITTWIMKDDIENKLNEGWSFGRYK